MKSRILTALVCTLLLGMYACVKPENQSAECGYSVSDVDGHSYLIVKIGDQCWMASNLTTTRFRNGDSIVSSPSAAAWTDTLIKPRWCHYNNSDTLGAIHGKLYNWKAVTDPRGLCPTGWHVPDSLEIVALYTALGGKDFAAGELKANAFWDSPNTGATNSTGFTALGSGYRFGPTGDFQQYGRYGFFWTSDGEPVNDTISAMCFAAAYSSTELIYTDNPRSNGFSIRCVKD